VYTKARTYLQAILSHEESTGVGQWNWNTGQCWRFHIYMPGGQSYLMDTTMPRTTKPFWRIMSTWCSNRISAGSCTNTHSKTCDRRVWWRWKRCWTCTVTRSKYYWCVLEERVHQHHIVTWTLFWKRNGS